MSKKTLYIIIGCIIFLVATLAFLFRSPSHTVSFGEGIEEGKLLAAEEVVPEEPVYYNGDIGPQPQLEHPPETIKALYSTAWSAGSSKKLPYFLNLFNTTELNAIVIDVKDYTGIVSYRPDNAPLILEYDAWEDRIPKINTLIKTLHDNGVYVIGRIAIFEDDKLAHARPELALHSSSTGEIWTTNKKIAWVDTASKDVWDYNLAIAKDMIARGFDEVNFDYIRFPSDGALSDIKYPVWDETTYKYLILKDFFKYVREQMGDATISADVFGEVTYAALSGIGQKLEDVLQYFDYVAPMTYPSHYARGFLGYQNPGAYPYEVVQYSMQTALDRLQKTLLETTEYLDEAGETVRQTGINEDARAKVGKFRPWFQDFDLGAEYTADMIRAQIRAYDEIQFTEDFGMKADEFKNGWMIWAPSNIYTPGGALLN